MLTFPASLLDSFLQSYLCKFHLIRCERSVSGLLGKVSSWPTGETPEDSPSPSISSFLLWTMPCEQGTFSILLQLPCASKCWCVGIAGQSNGRSLCPHIWVASPALELSDLLPWRVLWTCCWERHPWYWPSSLLTMPCLIPSRHPSFQPWVVPQGIENIKHREKMGSHLPLGSRWPETLSDELFWILLLPPPLKDWGGRTFLS